MQPIVPRGTAKSPDEVRSWAVTVMACVAALTAVAVAIRLISRRLRRQKLWWDDWLCIMSMIWCFGIAAIILAEMSVNGMGYRESQLDARRISQLIQVFTVGEVVYGLNTALTKIAVLLLYYRLLQVAFQTSKLLRVLAYGIGALVIMSALIFIFTIIFECVPVQKKWQPDLPGHCAKKETSWILNAVLTIFTDVAILLVPLPQIWRMHLGVLEKIGVTLTFALGWCVTFISSYRLHLLLSFPDDDFTYNILPIVVWSYTEIAMGIVSACLPISKPAVLWTTHKLGLTGQNGCLSQLQGSIKSWHLSSTGKSAGGGTQTLDEGVSTSAPGEELQGGGGKEGGSETVSRYLWSGENSGAHAMAGEDSPGSLEAGDQAGRMVELRSFQTVPVRI